MLIKWSPSPNFRAGRNNRQIIAIVNHITAGLMPGTLSWLQNPSAKASAHYLVTKSGQIYQLVKDEDTAWHAGVVKSPSWLLYDGTNPNNYTIGIEHEALAGEGLTEEQYQATLWLHRQLIQKHNLAADSNHIIGHYRIDSVNRKDDPGSSFPWDRLLSDLISEVIWPTVPVKVADKELKGIIINNTAFAPIRALAETLGFKVDWDSTLNAALIPPVTVDVPPGPSGTVRFVTGSVIIPGKLIDGKSYAPVRLMSEALGHSVVWDAVNRVVTVM